MNTDKRLQIDKVCNQSIKKAKLNGPILSDQIAKNLLNINAYGGCLGRKYRRRTYMVAISSGELPRSFDPEISEWGNPSQ